jgi:Tol biopolymer transport system component
MPLYYTAQYSNGIGKEDIFVSAFYNGKYQAPQPVDTAVNSPLWEFNAFVSPDESYILFSSCGRKDDNGGCDLYMSLKDDSGQWKPAVNLKAINSSALDYCPFVSFDRKTLYFTSTRHAMPSFRPKPLDFKAIQKLMRQSQNSSSNIYYVDFQKILESIK